MTTILKILLVIVSILLVSGCIEEQPKVTQNAPPASTSNKPTTKQICEKIKNKQGQLVEQCKTIKIYQKYDGTPVNPQQNKR